jgi:hypothetical protein
MRVLVRSVDLAVVPLAPVAARGSPAPTPAQVEDATNLAMVQGMPSTFTWRSDTLVARGTASRERLARP